MKTWYTKPAKEWTESLPLGNGRLGAMVFGGIAKERIALNEDTLWSGYPKNKNREGAAQYLTQARRLSMERRFGELENLIEDHMLGDYTESYLPLGDLLLTFPMINEAEAVEYVRDLVFEQAVAHTRFTYHNTTYCREVFVSHNAQALVMRLWSDSRNAITAEVELTSQLNANTTVCDNRICMEGLCPSHVEPAYLSCDDPVIYEEDDAKKGIRFSCIAQIETKNGTVQPLQNGRIVVSQADELVIKLVVRSSFNGFDCLPYLNGAEYDQRAKDDLHLLTGKTYEQVKEEHIADFQSYYGRVEFALQSTDEDNTPTDERLRRFSAAHPDLHLYELIFQFGRYLMISCSREGTQPSTLQGIWNQEYRAPWSSNYTVNINTEMNYWPAESCNLSELHEPLFRLIKEIRTTGAETAKCHYGAAGVCSHHNTDIWRMANPVGRTNRRTAGYAYWCMSFGWLCQHLFEHYEYTLDLRFLEKEAYPAIRDAALFYLDMLTPDENGHLILSPSTSPENAFLYDGAARKVDITTTMTTAIIKEVFTNAIKCCRLLHKDDGFAQLIQEKRAKLKPYEIGASGRLMEWYEDYADFEVTHRHISHLYPLHPGHEITVEDTPELAQACKRSLESRADGGTGWSLGWKINCWTRLRDGDHAVLLLNRQLRFAESGDQPSDGGGTYCNLFDAHPPFQIDGNFAASAGIAQMFVQSRMDRIILLPALPREWKDCHMKGLCVVGAMECDIFVVNGELEKAIIRAKKTRSDEVLVQYRNKSCVIRPAVGEEYLIHIDGRNDWLTAQTLHK